MARCFPPVVRAAARSTRRSRSSSAGACHGQLLVRRQDRSPDRARADAGGGPRRRRDRWATWTRCWRDTSVYLGARRSSIPAHPPRLYPGVAALLRKGSKRADDVVVGLLTGNVQPGARAKLAAVGIDPARFVIGGVRDRTTSAAWSCRTTAQRRARETLGLGRGWTGDGRDRRHARHDIALQPRDRAPERSPSPNGRFSPDRARGPFAERGVSRDLSDTEQSSPPS